MSRENNFDWMYFYANLTPGLTIPDMLLDVCEVNKLADLAPDFNQIDFVIITII